MALKAPQDAGAGSGAKASIADQLQEVDTSVLDRLVNIRLEETRLESFRSRAGEMKGQVSDQVFRRVVEDYTRRASALEQQATPLKSKGRAEYRKLHSLIGDVTRIRDQARLEKEELEFRHAVGELDGDQLSEGLASPQGRLDQCESDLARIEEYSARFIEAFGSKAELDKPEPAASVPARAPAAPPAAPPPRPAVTSSSKATPAVAAAKAAPVDMDATAYVTAGSPSDTSPPTALPDMTMIVD